MDYIPGHPNTAEGYEREPWRIELSDPNELEGKRVCAARVGDVIKMRVTTEAGDAGLWVGWVEAENIMPRLELLWRPTRPDAINIGNIVLLDPADVVAHRDRWRVLTQDDVDRMNAQRCAPIEPWYPPAGMTLGDMAASFEVLTVDGLRSLPVGSVVLELTWQHEVDSAPRPERCRPAEFDAYRILPGGRTEGCSVGYTPDNFEDVRQLEPSAAEGALRLAYRAPTDAPEPIPAPVCFVEQGDVAASKVEPVGTPARFGWSMYD